MDGFTQIVSASVTQLPGRVPVPGLVAFLAGLELFLKLQNLQNLTLIRCQIVY
jgi:hypothetical protein